jgi:transketolase
MTVVAPCDYHQAKKAAQAIAHIDGPVYMRFARAATPVFTTEDTPFEIGRADVYHDGDDVAIISCGPVTYHALQAAKQLEDEGINARVINSHTIKPLDKDTILQAAKETGAVVTVEEHQRHGGLGSAVAELLSEHHPTPMRFVAVDDHFGESGEPDELLEHVGLTAPHIKQAVNDLQ